MAHYKVTNNSFGFQYSLKNFVSVPVFKFQQPETAQGEHASLLPRVALHAKHAPRLVLGEGGGQNFLLKWNGEIR